MHEDTCWLQLSCPYSPQLDKEKWRKSKLDISLRCDHRGYNDKVLVKIGQPQILNQYLSDVHSMYHSIVPHNLTQQYLFISESYWTINSSGLARVHKPQGRYLEQEIHK